MADTQDLKSCERKARAGSTPASATVKIRVKCTFAHSSNSAGQWLTTKKLPRAVVVTAIVAEATGLRHCLNCIKWPEKVVHALNSKRSAA